MTERRATSPAPAPSPSPDRVALWLLGAAGLALGLWLRAEPLARAFLFGDELHSLGALQLPFSTLIARYDAVGSGLMLPIAQKALVAAFGASLPVLRAVAFVPSLALVGAVAWRARRDGGDAAAVVAALLVALAPVFVFYGHFARSYSLASLLCVGVWIACGSPDAPDAPGRQGSSRARVAWIAVLGGLAVHAHLVSAFFLVGLGAGVAVVVLARGGARRAVADPSLIGLAAGAVVAVALHWPARDSLLAFVGRKGEQAYAGGFGPLDVLGVLAGSPGATALLGGALLLATLVVPWRRGLAAAPVVCATWLPPLLLWLVSPYGDAYAYARYLLPSAAAGCVLVALGARELGRAARPGAPALPTVLAGATLAFAVAGLGPRGPLAAPLGPFANTYLGLYPLPAFTEGVPPAPRWYDGVVGLEPPRVLVEVPPLRNRAVHYLAALWRWHGQQVRMGTFGPIVPGAPPIESGLYVDLTRLGAAPPDFDALVVHRRIVDEVERYWARVYAEPTSGPTRALLDRHRVYGHDLPSVGRGVVDDLRAILGEPSHEDVDVVVWGSIGSDATAP